MATDDGVREVERGERLTGTPFGHWRGMRFGEGRRGGAVSGRADGVVLVGLPLLLWATAAVHLALEPQWWGVWSMVLAPITCSSSTDLPDMPASLRLASVPCGSSDLVANP